LRVFLDTNVLVSAFTTRGLCADVLREVLVHEDLLICPPLLMEVNHVLSNKFKLPDEFVSSIMNFLQEGTISIQKTSVLKIDISDKDDIALLGYAVGGRANVFVTGEREVQLLKKVRRLRIISPRDYWNLVQKRK